MRPIKLINEKQADGTMCHAIIEGCSFGYCTSGRGDGVPEVCDYLHSQYDVEKEELSWLCDKPTCLSGVDE